MSKVAIIYTYNRYNGNEFFVEKLKFELNKYHIQGDLLLVDNAFNYKVLDSYDLVIIRSIVPIITRYCKRKKILTINSSYINTIGNNKWLTYKFARKNRIETANTILVRPKCCKKINKLKEKNFIVAKSLDGHGGSEVFDLSKESAEVLSQKKHIILQEMCENGKDLRVYVIANKIIVSMLRQSTINFRSNYKLGGMVEEHNLTSEEKQLVEKILKTTFFDFAGIDLIYKNGKPILNEIEDIVGSRMLYENTQVDIIKIFAEWINEKINLL